MKKFIKNTVVVFAGILGLNSIVISQCEVFDFYDDLVPVPYWYACSGGDYTLNIYSPHDWTEYTIDWGDGSPIEAGTNWTSPVSISHDYSATVQNFNITITNPVLGCSISGVLVMEEATNPSIVIPTGVLTQACAPHPLSFSNQSSNVSENTIFTWDFGDGSENLVLDQTNLGQVISHVYEENTVDCNTAVTLFAENYCNTVQGGAFFNTFSPIQIYDADNAGITSSASVLCVPENEVTYTNTTSRNCFAQGNIEQRYEYWNFGDYWGNGQDSIIDWSPWPPSNPHTIQYPGNIGDSYEVMMIDSNFCGLDTAYMTVTMVSSPIADFLLVDNEICLGETITIEQNATGDPNSFSWNFGDGFGWYSTGSSDVVYSYSAPGTYTIAGAVGLLSSAACADTSFVSVTVVPSPVISILADNLSGCGNISANFQEASTNADNWDWDFGNGNTFNGSTPPTQNYNTIGDFVIDLTATNSSGCINTAQEIVSVFNAPVVNFIADNVCEGTLAQFTDISTSDGGDPIISWAWDFGDSFTSTEENPSHQYALAGTYNVNLSVSTVNCNGNVTIAVTVEAAPVPIFFPDLNSGCSPIEVTFGNSSIDSDSYAWDFGDQSGSFMEEPVHTFYNFTNSDTTYTVILTASSDFGCYQNDSLDITVFSGARAAFTDNAQPPGCAPFNAVFNNMSFGATSYEWDFGDGSAIDESESPAHVYANTSGFIQTYSVQLIAYSSNGCNDTIVSAITVYPQPDFTLDVTPNEGCSPLVVQMPLVASGQTFDWSFGDGQTSVIPNPSHLYTNNTDEPITYSITLNTISAFGCAGTGNSTLVVLPSPEVDFTISAVSGCSPLEVEITDNSNGISTGMYDYGDNTTGAYSGNATHTYTNISSLLQVYNITLNAENTYGCEASSTLPLEITPSANSEIVIPEPGCSPYQVAFLNNSTNATGFEWDFGNGLNSTQTTGQTTFINNSGSDTTYVVTLLALSPSGCIDIDQVEIVVYSSPVSNFTSDVNSGCSAVSVEFTNNSIGASAYLWSYGDGETSTTSANNHFHVFENFTDFPIEYIVTLTVFNETGCQDTYDLPITVNPQISAEFGQEENGCSPLTITFDNESFGANVDFVWNFGDGGVSSMLNPVHTFVNNTLNDTTFTVELISSSFYGCQEVYTQDIVVFATPIADISILDSVGCYPLDVTFENSSTAASSYTWSYGTGELGNSSEQLHTHTFYNVNLTPVTYTVTLKALSASGCESSDNVFVEVLPYLDAQFSSPNEGCAPYEVQFENFSNGALEYQWDFGDDSPLQNQINPAHLFENETENIVVYTVTLTIESYAGCTDTYSKDISVYPSPIAEFTASPESQTFPSTNVEIANNSFGGNTVEYQWGFGDGTDVLSGFEPADHTYETWGEYTISLIADNGICSDATTLDIEIIPPPPVANFEGPASGCSPLIVQFANESEYGLSYNWQFGDGGQAFVANPVYTYQNPGIYSVILTVTGYNNGEQRELVRSEIIEVYASAQAIFAATPEEVLVPQNPVNFINLSSNADEYLWNFGDGATSTEFSPDHFYQDIGTYSVSLWANNEYNCPDSILVVDLVMASALSNIEFPNAFTPIDGGSDGIYDPQSLSNNVFFPVYSGVVEYQLQIFNRWGELLFESKDALIGWDGMYRGQLSKQDVYVWKTKVTFTDGRQLIEAGDVTLLR